VILAGGYGSRLAAVLGSVPKALAPIRGRPFLDLLLEYLEDQGVKRAILCVGHLRDALIARYSSWPGVQVAFSIEAEPLGTGGAVLEALSTVGTNRFYVLNGDSYCNLRLADLLQFHVSRDSSCTLSVAPLRDRGDIGQVQLDGNGRVTSFQEKTPQAPLERGFMNAGVYVFERSAFDRVAPGRSSLEYDLIPRWVAGGRCYGFVTSADVIDIGTPDRYASAQRRL